MLSDPVAICPEGDLVKVQCMVEQGYDKQNAVPNLPTPNVVSIPSLANAIWQITKESVPILV